MRHQYTGIEADFRLLTKAPRTKCVLPPISGRVTVDKEHSFSVACAGLKHLKGYHNVEKNILENVNVDAFISFEAARTFVLAAI